MSSNVVSVQCPCTERGNSSAAEISTIGKGIIISF